MAEIPIPKPNTRSESSLVRGSVNGVNSLKSSTDSKQKVEPKPLKGGVKKKDPTFGEKLKRSFVKEDIKDIRDYIVFDVVVPSIRKAVFDTIVGTAAQIFGISVPRGFGTSSGYNGNRERLTPHERQYRDYSSIQRENRLASNTRIVQYDRSYVGDYSFTYKEDADSILEQMMDICDTYGWVSVSTFFELAGIDGEQNPYTNLSHGWRNLDGITVKFDGSGYVIGLPPARPKN